MDDTKYKTGRYENWIKKEEYQPQDDVRKESFLIFILLCKSKKKTPRSSLLYIKMEERT